jgi:hypothetical protein
LPLAFVSIRAFIGSVAEKVVRLTHGGQPVPNLDVLSEKLRQFSQSSGCLVSLPAQRDYRHRGPLTSPPKVLCTEVLVGDPIAEHGG